MRSKRVSGAIAVLVIACGGAALRADPADDNSAVLKQAKELIKKDKFAEAIVAYTQVLATDAKNVEALTRRGQAYAATGKSAEALNDLAAAIAADPADRNPLLERARIYEAQNAFAEAIKDVTAALAIKKDPSIYQMRAVLNEKARRLSDAIEDYTEVLKYQPTRGDILIARGKVHRLNGDGQKAGEDFGRAIRLNAGYQLLVNKALAEQATPARVVQPTLASVLPSAPAAPHVMKQPEAVVVQQPAKVAEPGPVQVAKATTVSVSAKPAAETPKPAPEPAGAPPAATPDPAGEKTPQEQQQVNSTIQAGRNQLTAKQYTEAITTFTKVIELRPKLAEGYARRCAANYLAGNTKPAIEDCSKALQIDMRDADAYYYRGRAYVDTKEYVRAIENLGNAIDLKPYFPEAHFYRGQAYQATDNLSQAIYAYSEAARQKQGYVEAIEARAGIKLYLGDKVGQQRDLELMKTAAAVRK